MQKVVLDEDSREPDSMQKVVLDEEQESVHVSPSGSPHPKSEDD
jgi:hypothetical protein